MALRKDLYLCASHQVSGLVWDRFILFSSILMRTSSSRVSLLLQSMQDFELLWDKHWNNYRSMLRFSKFGFSTNVLLDNCFHTDSRQSTIIIRSVGIKSFSNINFSAVCCLVTIDVFTKRSYLLKSIHLANFSEE